MPKPPTDSWRPRHRWIHHSPHSWNQTGALLLILCIHFSLVMVQKYTQSNGRRPFGLSMLIAGFDQDGSPRLYQTEPSGIFSAWKVWINYYYGHFHAWWMWLQANATGRSSKTVREFLEKNYTEEVAESEHETIKLAVKALLEVCPTSSKWCIDS